MSPKSSSPAKTTKPAPSKAKPVKSIKPKSRRALPQNVKSGHIYITATFNNTLISVTDPQGRVICWGSTGTSGFKGSRKSTPFASTTAIDNVLKKAKEAGLTSAQVFIKGPGPGRDSVLGVIRSAGLKVSQIADVTPIPHNGCRSRKRRRG